MTDRSDLKQPHEGIVGVLRDGGLVSLDERAIAHRDALIAMTKHLHTATLVGNPAPIVQAIYERITHPRVGDLVVESSLGLHTREPDRRLHAFGYLLERRREWWHTDDDWAAQLAAGNYDDEDKRPTDEAWYVQYGPEPANVYRWVNCSFLAIPTDRHAFDWPVGDVRQDGSVVMTRESVLAGLTESGFDLRTPR